MDGDRIFAMGMLLRQASATGFRKVSSLKPFADRRSSTWTNKLV